MQEGQRWEGSDDGQIYPSWDNRPGVGKSMSGFEDDLREWGDISVRTRNEYQFELFIAFSLCNTYQYVKNFQPFKQGLSILETV
jgi:hypothetical protein